MARIINSRFAIGDSGPVGGGGMSEVFEAFDLKEKTKVAIKLFKQDFASDEVITEAFSREQKSLYELNVHENIVSLIDSGIDLDSGKRFIAMEWVDNNLKQLVNKKRLTTWGEYFDLYGAQILEGLCFAFSRDILHRDITPNNILVTNDGVVKVADFSISKFKKYYGHGVTLADYKTAPYAPSDSALESPNSRDVFSYAVTSLECIFGGDFENCNDARAYLEGSLSCADDIHEILRSALSEDPECRPINVVDLYGKLRNARSRASREIEYKSKIRIDIQRGVITRVSDHTLLSDPHLIMNFILDDMNAGFLFKSHELRGDDGVWSISPDSFNIITSEFIYVVKRSIEDSGKLVVTSCRKMNEAMQYAMQMKAVPFEYGFVVGAGPNTKSSCDAIDSLLNAYFQAVDDKHREENKRKKEILLEKWQDTINARKEIAAKIEDRIRYEGFDLDGLRIHLKIEADRSVDESLVGQPRIIRDGDSVVVEGEIEWVERDRLTLYCSYGPDPERIPFRGDLQFDIRQTMSALNKQADALDAVRSEQTARSDFKKLLLDPSKQAPPEEVDLDYYEGDLDDSKKRAVTAAVGSEGFVVVEGPPGTGKTKFIVETILQLVNRGMRVLLTSQTHIALDNALERLQGILAGLDQQWQIVRIGRKDDPKIAKTSRSLLLENGVIDWIGHVKRRSENGFEKWASEQGVDVENVRISMKFAALKNALKRKQEIDSEVACLAAEKDEVNKQIDLLKKDPTVKGSVPELRAALDDVARRLAEKESTLRVIKTELDGAYSALEKTDDIGSEVYKLDLKDISELEKDYIGDGREENRCRQILDVVEDWHARLSRSDEFQTAYLLSSRVVAGTCVGIAGAKLSKSEFDVCIVDEASKALPTEMLIPMVKARKWVVVGDPAQLPPYLGDFMQNRDIAKKYDLDESDYRKTLLDHLIASLPTHSKTRLKTQYRMAKPIGDLVSHCFYGDLCSPKPFTKHQFINAKAVEKPVTWISTSGMAAKREILSRGSYKNLSEVEVIKNLLLRLQFAAKTTNENYTIVILSGYAAQVYELHKAVVSVESVTVNLQVQCCTVDTYQGKEADVAIYSVTRSNEAGKIGFLKEKERLNVALSRGKELLCIVGDARFCDRVMGDNPFREVLNYIRKSDSCAITGEA